MSQLLTRFFAAVHDFNACQTKGDYQNLKKYYDPDAELREVDPPYKKHTGRDNIIKYLRKTQPRLLPRFWPSLPTIIETPANSDTATAASLDGSATYFDCTTTAPRANRTPFVINFHFEFKRPDTGSLWLVTVGKRVSRQAKPARNRRGSKDRRGVLNRVSA
jgi:hypothetical protein